LYSIKLQTNKLQNYKQKQLLTRKDKYYTDYSKLYHSVVAPFQWTHVVVPVHPVTVIG